MTEVQGTVWLPLKPQPASFVPNSCMANGDIGFLRRLSPKVYSESPMHGELVD